MNHLEFNKVLEDVLTQTREVMASKNAEYANDADKLHNFNKASRIEGRSREQVLWGMALKHFVSVSDIRDQVAEGKLPSRELLDEKYGDLINYLILEKASIIDKINNSELKPRKVVITKEEDGTITGTIKTIEVIDPVYVTHKGCSLSSGCNIDPSLCYCQG